MLKLKFLVILVVSAGIFIVFFSLSGKTPVKNIDSKGKNIICFGDSITFGYGVKAGEDYPTVLSKMVNIPVINAGMDGDTSLNALKRVKKDVLDKEPFIVLIEFCGNDFIKDVPFDVTINSIREIVLQVQSAGAIAVIVDVSAGVFLKDYRDKFQKLARQTGSVFVPGLLSGIITDPSMKSDFMHPNKEGYRKIAERIYREIKPYLK